MERGEVDLYEIGDKIVYGSTGVCMVIEICTPNFSREERGKQYYKLRPVYGTETIYAPVDGGAFMRAAMTRTEAEALIARIPDMEGEECGNCSMTLLRQKYEAFFKDHSCESCIRLIKGVRQKEKSGKKLGQTDLRYLKRAEDTLYGELAVALEILPSQVPEHIKYT